MTETVETTPSARGDLSLKAVLGVERGDAERWSRLRVLQYGRLARLSGLRAGAHFIGIVLTATLYAPHAPAVVIAAWSLLTSLAVLMTARQDRELGQDDRRSVSRREFTHHIGGGLAVTFCWAAALAGSMLFGGLADQLALWSIVAALVTASALMIAAAPLATILFAGVCGLAAAASLIAGGHYAASLAVLLFCAGALPGTLTTARTYLQSRLAEAGVAEQSEVVSLLLREFEENEADWLWQIDPSRRVRSVSPRFAFALGRSSEELNGQPFLQLISGETWETGQFPTSLHDLAERLKRRESFSNLLVKVFIAGEERWWELSGTPMLGDGEKYLGHRGVGSDVTEQRESNEKIAYLARYDTLTSLPNRLMLNEALGEAMQYAAQWRTRCAFLMIDLDRFKAVNDSLGHLVGDRLLAQVSSRLQGLMSDSEMCGRLGGDEFAVVIRDAADRSVIDELARRIIERLSQPYEVDHHTLYVGASIGSAIGPRDGSSVEELMRNADLALYRAKEDGRGMHCAYEPSLHAMAEERRQLEFSLRKALERDELVLNYQPVVDANSETLVSFEALVRWHSKEHGFVSPGKFIPLAEDTRLIVPIGEWVLREACRQAMEWPRAVRVAVNVSAEQLTEPDFAQCVVRALSDSGLEPGRLELEVTESIFLRDPSTARIALEKIMALGCGVALDDFGTGYSSLGYLRQLRFSTIKVDRSFVQGARKNNNESLAIIRAVVAMAQSLEMSTTAEGCETEEEVELIRSLGCTKIQGFYFGRPMPGEDATGLFTRKRRKAG